MLGMKEGDTITVHQTITYTETAPGFETVRKETVPTFRAVMRHGCLHPLPRPQEDADQ